MKILIQRVTRAGVTAAEQGHAAIGPGLLALVGVTHEDSEATARHLAHRTLALRIFRDAQGQMNRSVVDTGGEILVISQFTLYADTRKGNRPSFVRAAPPELARCRYETYVAALREALGTDRVRTGWFGAHMEVELINDGPVTVELERGQKNTKCNFLS